MSKFVNEILIELKQTPESFKDYNGEGVQKNNIIVYQYSNSRVFSLIEVSVNNKNIPLSYIDRWRLESGIKNWYRTVSLKTLSA